MEKKSNIYDELTFIFGNENRNFFNGKTISSIVNIFHDISKDNANKVISEIYFLYYLLLFYKIKISDKILEFLFHKISVQKINEMIWKLQIFKEPMIQDMNKIQAIYTFINAIDIKCSISNIFIQDIFKPEYIFKKKYTPNSIDMYITSFYYLMQCTYLKKKFPLSVQSANVSFSFPLNIDLKEWIRPVFIIDVQNALLFKKTITINGKKYDTTSFAKRKDIILIERKYILEKLFEKHNLVGALILFISQSDVNETQNCLKITDLQNAETKNILGFNRVALFIEVPCSEFIYNIKNYFTPDISTINNTSGQKNNKKLYKYLFDKRNVLFYFDENAMKYKEVNPLKINKELELIQRQQKKQQNEKTFKIINGIKIYVENNVPKNYDSEVIYGQNEYSSFCTKECKIKNEQDDFMIGLILLLIQKTWNNCFKLVVEYIPIVFTNDNYDWMKTSLKKSCIIEKDFFKYLTNKKKHDITHVNSKKYKFWYGSKNLNSVEKKDIEELSQNLYKNIK